MAMVVMEGTQSIDRCDGIEHDGRDWLVPKWLDTPDGEWTTPERIIPVDRLPGTQKTNFAGVSYIVGTPIPKALFSGPTSQQLLDRYGVILNPPIRVALLTRPR